MHLKSPEFSRLIIKAVAFLALAHNLSSCAQSRLSRAQQPLPVSPPSKPKPSPMPDDFISGVTLDSVWDLPPLIDSLSKLARRPTARVVFDRDEKAATYVEPLTQIHKVANIMGELLDSFYVKSVALSSYSARTREYINALGNSVDIWEIGNEVNGEWLGSTQNVVAKMTSAYTIVKSRGKTAALTLYYNEDCWANANNEMFKWTEHNVSREMKSHLDYVFISYYEDDCNGLRPDWPSVFARLAKIFPNSKLGFGEVGTAVNAEKPDTLKRYYDLRDLGAGFVGGYFWWYFVQDMVPRAQSPLWSVLNSELLK
jgi:hypothetical protein